MGILLAVTSKSRLFGRDGVLDIAGRLGARVSAPNKLHQFGIGDGHSSPGVDFSCMHIGEEVIIEFWQVEHALQDGVPMFDCEVHEAGVANVVEAHQAYCLCFEDLVQLLLALPDHYLFLLWHLSQVLLAQLAHGCLAVVRYFSDLGLCDHWRVGVFLLSSVILLSAVEHTIFLIFLLLAALGDLRQQAGVLVVVRHAVDKTTIGDGRVLDVLLH